MPEAGVLVQDLPFAERDGETLLARVYRSSVARSNAPVVLDVHPGAWSEGDRTWGQVYDEALARRGFVVVAIDFRQAPRFRHPAASADVATAVRWMRLECDRLGVDPSRIASVGSSSGGHLALLAACRPNAPEHQGAPLSREDASDIDASVACVAALWPPVDPITRYGWLSERLAHGTTEDRATYEPIRHGMEAYFGDHDTMRAASVPHIVRAGRATHLPPVWACYPELDKNVPFSIVQDLEVAWKEAGGEISVTVYEGQPHAFAHRPSEQTERFVDELAAFLSRSLGGPD